MVDSMKFVVDDDTNYVYNHRDMQFQISQTCLEENPFNDLAIWNPISRKLKEWLGINSDDGDEFQCDSVDENKLKY